jgi:hypothetical protein
MNLLLAAEEAAQWEQEVAEAVLLVLVVLAQTKALGAEVPLLLVALVLASSPFVLTTAQQLHSCLQMVQLLRIEADRLQQTQ